MHVRRLSYMLAFALFIQLFALGASHAGAQVAEPPDAPEHGIRIARPRGAILTVFHSGAESFLLERGQSADAALPVPRDDGRLWLHADYEALFLPLTAGFANFSLSAALVADDGTVGEPLASDEASLVAFGPNRKSGRLGLGFALEPGLHRLRLVAVSKTRAVGVAEWTVDRDARDVWVIVAGITEGSTPEQTKLTIPVASPEQAPIDPTATGDRLPVGGLSVGALRGVAAPAAMGALNFPEGHNARLYLRAGQGAPIWADYELWWSDGAAADAAVELTIRTAPSSALDAAPLARDGFAVEGGTGPRLDDSALRADIAFDEPGDYRLEAHLETWVRREGRVVRDKDVVPFSVRVVGEPPRVGAIAGRVFGTPFLADASGIVGRIPLEGVEVRATSRDGALVARTRTNARGQYKLENLEPGQFLVQALPHGQNYVARWWRDARTIRDADPVDVAAGATTDGIDIALPAGATISGRVTNEDGRPLSGIEVTVGGLSPSVVDPEPPGPASDPAPVPGERAPEQRTKTNDEGYYALDGLDAGAYWVRARDPEGGYGTEYFDDAHSFADADPVRVRSGQTAAGIDFELATGGRIAGMVREQTDLTVILPLPGMLVEAFGNEDRERAAASARTGDDGRYALGPLREGTYLVRASDPNGGFLAEWFREAPGPRDAEPVAVRNGEAVDNIDFTLERSASGARLFVKPETTVLRKGDDGRFTVAVEGVEGLGAFEVELRWDPSIFAVRDVGYGAFLGSTGREVIPVEPEIDNEAGRLRFAAASVGDRPGPDGGGVLLEVHAVGIETGESEIAFSDSILTDTRGREIEHSQSGGKLVVGGCMFADFDCNCRIDIRDVMAVVVRWGSVEGDPDWDPRFDLNGDGRVNIVDVQVVAGLWGKVCTDASVGGGDRPLAGGVSGLDRAAPSGEPGVAPELAPGGTVVARVEPAEAGVGDRVRLLVDVSGAHDLAAFELSVGYDNSVLRFEGATVGPLLGRTGRTVTALGPDDDQAAGSVRFSAFSLPGAPAPSGDGLLAELSFTAVGTGSSSLALASALLVDSLGDSTEAGGANVAVSVLDAAPEPTAVPTVPSVHAEAFVPFAMRDR